MKPVNPYARKTKAPKPASAVDASKENKVESTRKPMPTSAPKPPPTVHAPVPKPKPMMIGRPVPRATFPTKPTTYLKSKLKQDIENLRREQLVKRQRLEDRKRRKALAKKQRKEAERLRRKMAAAQKNLSVQKENLNVGTLAPTTTSAVPTGSKKAATPTIDLSVVTPRLKSIDKHLDTKSTVAPLPAKEEPSLTTLRVAESTGATPNIIPDRHEDASTESNRDGALVPGSAKPTMPSREQRIAVPNVMNSLTPVQTNTPFLAHLPISTSAPLVPQPLQNPWYQPQNPYGMYHPLLQSAFFAPGQAQLGQQVATGTTGGAMHPLLFQQALFQQQARVPWIPYSSNMRVPQYSHAPQMSTNSLACYSTVTPANKSPREPRQMSKPGATTIAKDLLKSPSPFAATHELLPQKIVLVKKPEESFGVIVGMVTESTLVGAEWFEQNAVEDSSTGSAKRLDANGLRGADQKRKSTTGSKPSTDKTDESNNTGPNIGQEEVTSEREKDDGAKLESSNPPSGSTAPSGESDALLKDGVGQDATLTAPAIPSASTQKQKRRRRYYFAAISVQDPAGHNTRQRSSDFQNMLKAGDLLLEINGQTTATLTFQEAVSLIKKCAVADEDGLVRCPVVVARRKIAYFQPAVSKRVPTNAFSSTPLSASELIAFTDCLLKTALSSQRVLGGKLNETLERLVATKPELSSRGIAALNASWSFTAMEIERRIEDCALSHWKEQWTKEPDEVRKSSPEFLTDAHRSVMRSLPRPTKGCRCGSQDHEYVNHLDCPLYGNLRILAPTQATAISVEDESKRIKSKLPSDLNVVQKAYKERFVRMKTEQSAQEAEARFVSEMEEIQLKRCGQAVFAPSLEAIVLSTISELQSLEWGDVAEEKEQHLAEVASSEVKTEGPGQIVATNNPPKSLVETANNGEASDSDDDDVPLSALEKRPAPDLPRKTKKQKNEVAIRFHYLGKLLNAISRKWGHAYMEPRDMEYAWRWEVFHGQHSDTPSDWEVRNKNPRKGGSLSLENIQFGLNEEALQHLEKDADSRGKEYVEALKTLAHFGLPEQSGVCDELLALMQGGVVMVDARGIPKLSKDWWANVDLLLLEDMHFGWGENTDPLGKYGIAEEVREQLGRRWRRTGRGWVFVDEPKEVIFDFEEFDDWREAFEHKQQAHSEDTEGIGQFGI